MSAYDRETRRSADADDEVIEIDTVSAGAVPDQDTVGEYDQGTVTDEDRDADDQTGQIRENIERTRADMSDTIDAIQDKLNPQRMAEQVTEQVREATIGRAEDMVNEVRETARDAGFSIVDTIRENPVPAALAALGIGWLWMKRPSSGGGSWRGSSGAQRRYRYGGYQGDADYDQGGYEDREYGYRGGYRRSYGGQGARGYSGAYRGGYQGQGSYQGQGGAGQAMAQAGGRVQQAAGQASNAVQDAASQATDAVQGAAGQAAGAVQQAAGQVGDTVGQVAGQAGQTVQQWGGQVQDTAQQLGSQLQYRAQSARWNFEGALQENPLGLAAIALAAGVAVGLAAPSTDIENQMMGEARDNLVQQAQDKAQDTVQKVQQVAQRTAETAKDTAQDEADKQGLTKS